MEIVCIDNSNLTLSYSPKTKIQEFIEIQEHETSRNDLLSEDNRNEKDYSLKFLVKAVKVFLHNFLCMALLVVWVGLIVFFVVKRGGRLDRK